MKLIDRNKIINEPYKIAVTKTQEKADQIQAFLKSRNCPSEQDVILNARGDEFGYIIKLKENIIKKKDYCKTMSELHDSLIIDNSVEFLPCKKP